ncbi:MAG: DUF3553 domain-containing protein [Phycisphaeraceae bacterium]|nr:DUF3553 domain-containing protein [Phycisphaeraceae bacterium]
MVQPREWNYGDKVVHMKRPEWGTGVVTAAAKIVHEGTPCQRLTIRFDRAGVKTLSTALAELGEPSPYMVSAGPGSDMPERSDTPGGEVGGGWLDKLSAPSAKELMSRLPEACTDPFSGLGSRLRATLALFRFSNSGASLLDWAASQSGLKDPLSQFNRHELEVLFDRFAFVRDDHLKKVALDLKKKDPAEFSAVVKTAPAGAQQTLKRLDLLR